MTEARPPSPRPALPAAMLLVFYGVMAAAAYALAWLFDVPSLWHRPPEPPGPLPLWAGLVAGIALGLGAHGLGALARRRFEWARSFYERIAEVLGPVSTAWVVLAAAASGLAEELLFRGVLLPLTGLWVQALLFGLLHVGPGKAFRFWPVYAAAMGLGFGLLYQASGSLLPAVLAHFTVNYFGLSTLIRRDRESSAP